MARTANKEQRSKLKPLKYNLKGGKKALGVRLSASWYYNETCHGKLKLCMPKLVNGVWKKIKIVDGKTGLEPRWMKVGC